MEKTVDTCKGRRITMKSVSAHGKNKNLTWQITKNVASPKGKFPCKGAKK